RILNILSRRKFLLIGTIAAALILAFLYNTFTPPVYESTTVLKKENTEGPQPVDQLSEIFELKTRDEIETEIELVNTWEVLSKVIEELDLYLTVEKIIERGGKEYKLNQLLVDYNDNYFRSQETTPENAVLPRFLESNLKPSNKEY